MNSQRMDPKWKARWIAALRGGKYTQGRKMLRSDDDKYCCLGVLCDISGVGKWRPGDVGYSYNNYGAVAPASVCSLTGLPVVGGASKMGMPELAERNDGGATFEELADLIEEYL